MPLISSWYAARYLFVIFITLNILTFYGIMSVFITPDVAMASVLSGTFYGEHLGCPRLVCLLDMHSPVFMPMVAHSM